MHNFILYALLAGVGIALTTGPLGSFIVWRKMAFFGDALSHSAILGVSVGFALTINPYITVISVCMLFALILVLIQHNIPISVDTLLGILAHSTLSFGLIITSFIPGFRADLMSYLFGDLLSVSTSDLVWIFGVDFIILLVLLKLWQPLLSTTVHEELAKIEGVNTFRVKLILALMLSLIVAISMKIVGALLITSMLIIPAASAQYLAKSPEQMVINATIIGILSIIGGISYSLLWDTPTGPSVVACGTLIFVAVLSITTARKKLLH